MGRISIPTGGLLVIGVILVTLAGFDDGIPPSSDWERYLPYFLLIGGFILIVLAIVLILRKQIAATRITAFVAVYTLSGLLMPIQGYVTVSFAIGTIVTAVLYGLALHYLNTNIPLGRKARFLITWLAIYVIQMLMPVLEGVFFSTQFEGAPELVFGALIFGWLLVLPTALAGTLLFSPTDAVRSFTEMRSEYFESMSTPQFVGRYAISSALWMAIYFVFGAVVGPYVLPYYTEGGAGYELLVPELHIILSLQLFRGFILVLMILPLIISTNLDWKRLAIIIAALLYVGGALAIFLISEQYPLHLRLLHGMEMFADAAVAGIVIAYILGRHTQPLTRAFENEVNESEKDSKSL